MTKVTLRAIGNAKGVILPKETLTKYGIREGDELYLVETRNGLEISPYDPDFEAQMESAERLMRQYKNTLKALAK